MKSEFAEGGREKESSMLRWLTPICDKKGTRMLSQLPAAADGGKGENLAFGSFV